MPRNDLAFPRTRPDVPLKRGLRRLVVGAPTHPGDGAKATVVTIADLPHGRPFGLARDAASAARRRLRLDATVAQRLSSPTR